MKTSNLLIIGGLAAAALIAFSGKASASDIPAGSSTTQLGGFTSAASSLASKAGEPTLKNVLLATYAVLIPGGLGNTADLRPLSPNQAGRVAALGASWQMAAMYKILRGEGVERPTWQAILLNVFERGTQAANAPQLTEQVLAEAKVDPLYSPDLSGYPLNANAAINAAGLSSLSAAWKEVLNTILIAP